MNGENPNTPEFIDGKNNPDYVITCRTQFREKILLLRPYLPDEIIEYEGD